jgi:integrase
VQCSPRPTQQGKEVTGDGRKDQREDKGNRPQALLNALPDDERALWGCAFYGGLRHGELRALRWSDVDFKQGIIRVQRGRDDKEGAQATKSEAGERCVPLAGVLRPWSPCLRPCGASGDRTRGIRARHPESWLASAGTDPARQNVQIACSARRKRLR